MLASQQRLQALVARFADELACARTVGDAREAAYIREKAARGQRLRDKAVASDAAGCVSLTCALVVLLSLTAWLTHACRRAAARTAVEASSARLKDSATPQVRVVIMLWHKVAAAAL